MSDYILWTFAGLQVLGAFAMVAMIDKERKPVTRGAAGFAVLFAFVAVVAVLGATR